IYALFNNTPNTIKALHNCWIEGQESTAEDVESVISHIIDDPELGEVLFDPFECGIEMGITDLNQSNFMIYPNPVKNSFTIDSTEKGIVKIYDLNGKLIQSETKTTNSKQINNRYIINGILFRKNQINTEINCTISQKFL